METDKLEETEISITVCFVCLQTRGQLYISYKCIISYKKCYVTSWLFTIVQQSNAKHLTIYNICLISIINAVSCGSTKALVLNIERAQQIICLKEFEPVVLNTFCATRV